MTSQVLWFNCLGEVHVNDTRFGDSFLKKCAIRTLFNDDIEALTYDLNLFGKKYDANSALHFDQQELFHRCRQNYLSIYQSATKTDFKIFGARIPEKKCIYYYDLRKEICVFMNYISSFLANCQDGRSGCINNEIIFGILKSLSSFWNLLKNLHSLPDFIVYSGCTQGNKNLQSSFHLLHLHLDLIWYRLVILNRLMKLAARANLQDVTDELYEKKRQFIYSLVDDLFTVAILRFEKVPQSDIRKVSPFPCTCFKEMWLIIQLYLDKSIEEYQQNDFWTSVNYFCSRLLQSTENREKATNVYREKSSNDVLFTLWIIFHLGKLYLYNEIGEYIGISCDRIVSNYPMMEKILKLLLSAETVTEAQLRSCIPFITDLTIDLWPTQRDPIYKLWEHFHHRLNGCFFLPGASADGIATNCSDGAEILQFVIYILEPPTNFSTRSGNSFHLFLQFLGKFLQNNPLQWPNIKGRIFSKFSPTKMQNLKEMGIFNFTCLFLGMAWTGHTQEVGDKMQVLLSQAITDSVDVRQRLMVWKSHLALLQLYIKKEMDISEGTVLLMEDVHRVINSKDPNTMLLFGTLVKDFNNIIISSKTLNYSEQKLIGNWVHSYLKLAAEPTFLISTLLELMKKVITLSKSVGMIEYNASDSHFTKIFRALCNHLLPYIKEMYAVGNTSNRWKKIADLAAGMTLLTLNRTNVGVAGASVSHLLESFTINANPINANLSIRYLCILQSEEIIYSEILETYNNYEVLIIQTWLRCSMYTFQEDCKEDLSRLTEIVSQLPSFLELYRESCHDVKSQTVTIETFIFILGCLFAKKYNLEEKSQFREKSLIYLTPMIKSFERMLRNKSVDEKIYCRMYEVAADLILECGRIIYSKTQPYCLFNTLINSLLLPTAIFKPGVEMPLPMMVAMQRTFPKFMKGLLKLNNAAGNTLSSTIKSLVVRYFPRLVGKSLVGYQESNKESAPSTHPFLLCFQEEEVSKTFLEIISHSFLKAGDPQCMNALMFLLQVLQEKSFNEQILKIFIDTSLIYVLEVIILSDSNIAVIKRQAIHLIKEALNYKINTNITLRESFWAVLWAVIQKRMIFHPANIMNLLCKLCEVAPEMIRDALPQIKEMITSPTIFHRANVAKTMRLGVENMEKLLSLHL